MSHNEPKTPRRDEKPRHARYDPIHRALLAGLLSNVGTKTEAYEYQGARGVKFSIFPGSSQFKQNPQWVMASELVETTRLYARTVARIRPEWVERIGEHLLKHTYFDPHWNPQTAHVVAYEKVSLYGIILVPQRSVHYGPIDPVKSRELFIQHALVEGEFQTDGPFFRLNQRLIEEIQRLEAKSRSRDVLVDPKVRFDFYDSRVPAGIYSGPLFEKWRRDIERHNPKILCMTRRDLMLHSASGVTHDQFPDFLLVKDLRLPLEYHLEPGHAADGVTANIPLAVLNQLTPERFEWLVPGLLREKITALIKSLPKDLRVNFVPAPEFADAAASALEPGSSSLVEALAAFLGRQRGVVLPKEAFDPGSLLDHLHFNFKVIDESKKVLATGRNLDEIRCKLGVKVAASLAEQPHPVYHRDKITSWNFGDLPESVAVKRHGMTLTGYPALADLGESVGLRLLDSAVSAAVSHAAGLRKLLLYELRDEIRYVGSMLPGFNEMAMCYKTLGNSDQLRDEIMAKAINRAFLYDSNVRTAMEYELRKEAGRRHRLLEIGQVVAQQASAILSAYHQLALQLGKPAIDAWQPVIADVRMQLAELMPRGFLATTPDERLAHFPRYLKGMMLRLQKLASTGHTKDAQRMAEVSPFWQAYLGLAKRNREQRIVDPALDEFRWMIEELRVSLFAQGLRSAIPISVQRVEKQWSLVRK